MRFGWGSVNIVPGQFPFGKAVHGFATRQRSRLIAACASVVLAITGIAFTPTQAKAALACSVDLSGSTIGQATTINMLSVASACGVAGGQFAGFTLTNGVDVSTASVAFTAVGYSAPGGPGADYVPTPTTLPSPDGHANVTFNQPGVVGGNDFNTMVFTVNSTNGSTSAVFSQFFCDSNGDFVMDTSCALTIQLPPLLAPTATVAASPATIAVGATSTLTFTLTNPNPSAALSGVADTVALPAGVAVAATPNSSSTCGGTVTAVAGSSSLALSGGALALSASCTFKVDVTATTTGAKTIPTGTPSATSAAPGAPGTSATLTVNALLTTAQAVPTTTLTANTPAASFTPVTGSGGVGTLSYALSGASLPAGLTFSTSSGLIAGTPTALLATTTFTVTVTDQSAPTPQTSSKTFTLTVNAALLATTQAVASTTLTTNTPATPFIPVTASGGFGTYSYALSGATLPSGLTFSTTTGQISGTPTTPLVATVFTVTVTDHTTPTAQTSSKTFSLTVNAAPLVTTQAVPSTTLTTNTPATPFIPVTASGGFGTYSYALSGATLPTGLNFNTATGQISGTPTTLLSVATFTVTVTDQTTPTAQTSSKTFTLTVNASTLVTTQAVPSTTLTAGTAATPFTPVTASGGFGTFTFALSGATLPAGLSFSTTTGQITGTPTTLLGATTFTVTVTDQTTPAAQTSSKTFSLTVNAVPLATTQAVPTTTLSVSSAATPFTPVTASGGFGTLSFAVSGATLPAGLSFSTTTGQITGTPTALLAATTFTVTVTDQTTPTAQTSSKTFSLTVTAVTLVTTQAVPTTTLTAGTAATPFTPVTATGGFGTLTFALSGATLPAGLNFSTSTGQITGTPTALLVATTFTVTVTDQTTPTAQTSAKTFSLTVTATSLATTQAIPSTALTAGSAATPFTPVTASGGFGTLTFALSGATLPAGLSFSTTTGQINGTPSAALAATTFTVTVTDQTTPTAQTSSKTFSLTVNPALTTTQAVPSTTLTAGSPVTPFTPVTAAGGFGTLTFALSGATLPSGLTFSTTTGQITGTPATAVAATTFTVTVTDQTTPTAQTSSKTFSLTVVAPVFVFTPAAGALARRVGRFGVQPDDHDIRRHRALHLFHHHRNAAGRTELECRNRHDIGHGDGARQFQLHHHVQGRP